MHGLENCENLRSVCVFFYMPYDPPLTGTFNPGRSSLLVNDVDNSLTTFPSTSTAKARSEFTDHNTQYASISAVDSDVCNKSSAVSANEVLPTDESSSYRQTKSDIDKRQRLPVLDPLHLKGIWRLFSLESWSTPTTNLLFCVVLDRQFDKGQRGAPILWNFCLNIVGQTSRMIGLPREFLLHT